MTGLLLALALAVIGLLIGVYHIGAYRGARKRCPTCPRGW